MTEEQIALAKRAVACRGWRWMPGMLTLGAWRVVDADETGIEATTDIGDAWRGEALPPIMSSLPDLTDPATLGCLLALVREAWGDPYASSRWMKPVWKMLVQRMGYMNYTVVGEGYTEFEALVAALEAAP